jgi:hypothetical protein
MTQRAADAVTERDSSVKSKRRPSLLTTETSTLASASRPARRRLLSIAADT